jgi:hypothetical protein
MTGAVLLFTALLTAWVIASWLPVRGVAEPSYRVVSSEKGYEIREYAPYVIAETFVSGKAREGRNAAFRRLAGYIFGDNTQKRKVPMTAPVLSSGATEGRRLSMTAPVLAAPEGDGTVLAFVMPEGETLESLPSPNESRVRLRSVPQRRAAAARVSFHPSEIKVEKKRADLLRQLERDGYPAPVNVAVAYYNPPWTVPFMRRTEVLAWLDGEEDGRIESQKTLEGGVR